MRKHFTISEEDWKELERLAKEVQATDTIVYPDPSVGPDFAILAHKPVMDYWRKLGEKYGFVGMSVQAVIEKARIISAIEAEGDEASIEDRRGWEHPDRKPVHPDDGTPHINMLGDFQSNKYPWCPPGFVPIKVDDPMANDLLRTYAARRAAIDKAFARDLLKVLD